MASLEGNVNPPPHTLHQSWKWRWVVVWIVPRKNRKCVVSNSAWVWWSIWRVNKKTKRDPCWLDLCLILHGWMANKINSTQLASFSPRSVIYTEDQIRPIPWEGRRSCPTGVIYTEDQIRPIPWEGRRSCPTGVIYTEDQIRPIPWEGRRSCPTGVMSCYSRKGRRYLDILKGRRKDDRPFKKISKEPNI